MKPILCALFWLIFQQVLKAQEITLPLWPAGNVPNYQKTGETEKRDTGETIKISLVQSGGHGFGLGIGRGRLERWMDLCVEWLRAL